MGTPRAPLRAGGEAMLAERMVQKFLNAWAQPPRLPRPDALPPAGRSTNCHPPGWHQAVALTAGGERTAERRAAELARRVYGGTGEPWSARSGKALEPKVSDEVLRPGKGRRFQAVFRLHSS